MLNEKHYTPKEVAVMLRWSDDKVRRRFGKEDEVILDGHPSERRQGKMLVRHYYRMQISESLVLEVYESMKARHQRRQRH